MTNQTCLSLDVFEGCDLRSTEASDVVRLASETVNADFLLQNRTRPFTNVAAYPEAPHFLRKYPHVQTAVVTKEALEGHCIYDGGFCKLHITYSLHTDLSIKCKVCMQTFI